MTAGTEPATLPPADSRKRSIAKTVTWRAAATLTTFLISVVVFTYFRGNGTTGAAKAAGIVAAIEVPSKLLLYYLHERAWTHVTFGHAA